MVIYKRRYQKCIFIERDTRMRSHYNEGCSPPESKNSSCPAPGSRKPPSVRGPLPLVRCVLATSEILQLDLHCTTGKEINDLMGI